MALGLRRKRADEKGHDDAADHGREHDPHAPATGRGEDIGVVVQRQCTIEEEIVEDVDKVAEENRADAGHNAERQRPE
ncbi:MAG: hypothetical protein WAU68_14625 [Vitreimonas sp.]